MSVTVIACTGIAAGTAVRMSSPNYAWTGVVRQLRTPGRAELVITDPGDSIHYPGQVVVVAARLLTPLRGGEGERNQARAELLQAAPPLAAKAPDDPGSAEAAPGLMAVAEAIEAGTRQMTRDIDDAAWLLGERISQAADTIALAIELAASRPRRRWPRRTR